VYGRDWLYGWEADVDAAAINGNSSTVVGAFTVDTHVHVPFFGTVRGRVGKITDLGLFYATGGLLYTGVKTRVVSSAGTTTEDFELQAGWTVGAGWEKYFTDRLSAKLEYLYLSPADVSLTNLGVSTVTSSSAHSVRLGVNYHFR
jgi:opacity protein-like surface antigen